MKYTQELLLEACIEFLPQSKIEFISIVEAAALEAFTVSDTKEYKMSMNKKFAGFLLQ